MATAPPHPARSHSGPHRLPHASAPAPAVPREVPAVSVAAPLHSASPVLSSSSSSPGSTPSPSYVSGTAGSGPVGYFSAFLHARRQHRRRSGGTNIDVSDDYDIMHETATALDYDAGSDYSVATCDNDEYCNDEYCGNYSGLGSETEYDENSDVEMRDLDGGVMAPPKGDMPSLDAVLANAAPSPYTLAEFTSFLAQNHCLETLEFTSAVARYTELWYTSAAGTNPDITHHPKDTARLNVLWQLIVDSYVRADAVHEVNLPHDLRDALLHLTTLSSPLSTSPSSCPPLTPSPPHPSALEPALAAVKQLMRDTLFLRFLHDTARARRRQRRRERQRQQQQQQQQQRAQLDSKQRLSNYSAPASPLMRAQTRSSTTSGGSHEQQHHLHHLHFHPHSGHHHSTGGFFHAATSPWRLLPRSASSSHANLTLLETSLSASPLTMPLRVAPSSSSASTNSSPGYFTGSSDTMSGDAPDEYLTVTVAPSQTHSHRPPPTRNGPWRRMSKKLKWHTSSSHEE
ncbi:uncharacterized protein V1518DRAFT_277752 [Limtongia smithiae]|uniref:uncharacterized protein n=1 Tax=Limtongia smithiae TaxID=1125753 RepID=UPI0034CE20DF